MQNVTSKKPGKMITVVSRLSTQLEPARFMRT
jgi:hypothetical protein